MSSEETKWVRSVLPVLDTISSTACMAKWFQTTIYLQTGETHSCYHPAPHKIPIEELKDNPSALHNTLHKKNERKEMLEGKQTSGCDYCWRVENLGGEFISDRLLRSSTLNNSTTLDVIKNGIWDQNVNPRYLELSFSNECNFKCGYCHPKASTRYFREIQQHGPYTMVKNHRQDIDWFKTYDEAENPYLDAFWEWWPSLKNDLEVLRLTGGEPLMHKSTWRLFDAIKNDPMPNLELNLNSNLGGKTEWVQRLCDNINELVNSNSINRFKLYTSIDTWGKKAEYIRTGLDIELWEKNLDLYIRETRSPVVFMITFNLLSVTSFRTLLEKILEWRKLYSHLIPYGATPTDRKIRFDTPFLTEPIQYDINILPKDEFMHYMDSHLQFMIDNHDEDDVTTFSDMEIEKFRRVVEYMRNTHYSEERVYEGRKDFGNWFQEYDKRRGTNFSETFPELQNFYENCKNL
jgi:organic radical activating enzyme